MNAANKIKSANLRNLRALNPLRHGASGMVTIVLLACLEARGATIPIEVIGGTQTQIVIRACYTPISTPLAITVTDNNGGPKVNDVDGTIFPNSNTDLGRVTANGFRWPTMINGDCRTIVIGGHDEIKQGADGKWY